MRKFIAMIPLFILVPVLYWLVFWGFGYPMNWLGFGIGVLGWWIAYVLRIPVMLILQRIEKKPSITIAYFSGPLEEGVRLIALLFAGMTMHWSLSIGQGWAAIEVAFAIVQGLGLASLRNRTDEKAMQAKEMMQSMGIPLNGSPLWGVMERIFASAFHIGSTLLIAWNPWLVVLMIPVHTALNVVSMRLLKKSLALMEFTAAGLGTVVIAAGLIVNTFM